MKDLLEQLRRQELAGGKGAGASENARAKEGKRSGFLERVPPHLRDHVKSIAKESHFKFRDRFPDFIEFTEAVAECWLEQVEGFEAELKSLGYREVISGTSPQDLHQSSIAALTISGTLVFIGPGAFRRAGEGAALIYKKITLRDGEVPDTTQEKGFIFARTPRVGESILANRKDGEAPFLQTSDVLKLMMRPTEREYAQRVLAQ